MSSADYCSNSEEAPAKKHKLSYKGQFRGFKDCLLHCVADMERGDVGKMDELGITESFQVKRQVLVSGAEAAEMIIRVDNIIKSAPRQRPRDDRYHWSEPAV